MVNLLNCVVVRSICGVFETALGCASDLVGAKVQLDQVICAAKHVPNRAIGLRVESEGPSVLVDEIVTDAEVAGRGFGHRATRLL